MIHRFVTFLTNCNIFGCFYDNYQICSYCRFRRSNHCSEAYTSTTDKSWKNIDDSSKPFYKIYHCISHDPQYSTSSYNTDLRSSTHQNLLNVHSTPLLRRVRRRRRPDPLHNAELDVLHFWFVPIYSEVIFNSRTFFSNATTSNTTFFIHTSLNISIE